MDKHIEHTDVVIIEEIIILKVVNIHVYARAGQKPPKAEKYEIQIDRIEYLVDKEHMTGRELLTLAGKLPVERFQLNQKLHKGKVEKIGLDQVVCFTDPGVEKFMTVPLDQTEGKLPRRQFTLPEEDLEALNTNCAIWETVSEGNGQWVLIDEFPLPNGYGVQTATIAIKIEPGYPRTQLDMVYVYPPLQRADNQPINALCGQMIDGKMFQRWSRHRTGENPWRDGEDNLSTHLLLVSFWFEQEFQKRPAPYAVPA
ncbi:hypothetical protein GCM10023189_44860 [Nibrella saemangeumensis]|uniref:Multi-ubiquitin domain-containing protein n=1 Tax=Nibrella saemangeumensis TaxID=1084526 RepID=A0ABP8NFC4_9BACT